MFKFDVNLNNKQFMETRIKEAITEARPRNVLLRQGYKTIGDLVNAFDSPDDMRGFKGMSPKGAASVFKDIFEVYINTLSPEKYEAYVSKLRENNTPSDFGKIVTETKSA